MWKPNDTQIGALAAALLALAAAVPACADDTPKGDVAVLYLGKLAITGQQKIVDTLLGIRAALKQPLSDAPEDANKVVCRINKPLGETHEYLDCATNANLNARRAQEEQNMLTHKLGIPSGGEMSQQDFDSFIAQQPNQHLHVPVNGGALQALLATLPDDAKVVDNPAPVQ